MKFYKFVTEDFKSPNSIYSQLDYSHFGIPITVDAAHFLVT